MNDTSNAQTLGFQAEVRQLLHLMVHSLYSNREIFLRELISNASDACDKLRFEALSTPELLADDLDLAIRIEADADAGVVRVIDNGIGMSREEVIENLGTIARSGTADFLGRLSGDARKDAKLIGQFGVGFYSAFIVADRVDVYTRRAGADAADGVCWSSDGQGEFSVSRVERAERGTLVELHLKEDAREFAAALRLETLVRRYSDHIGFPVTLREGDGEARSVNSAQALWTRPRSEIGDDEYREFYQHIAHDVEAPLAWTHAQVEGKREYTVLMYLPSRAPWDLYQREAPRGLKLYVQRVFILDDAEQFLPLYLRFIRGVIDCADLSLNVSRELLQQDAHVDAIRKALTKRALDMLADLAKNDPEAYAKAWGEFGNVLKEGLAEDFANRERIAGLLRFTSTHDPDAGETVTLDTCRERMVEGQKSIYYLVADGADAARASPHLEVFRERGIEVLLLTDRIDEWVMQHLTEYDGVALKDVARGELDLSGAGGAGADGLAETREKEYRDLVKRLKRALRDRVSEVRVSRRLTESPACLVIGEHDPGEQMRRILEATGQEVPDTRPALEINPGHPLVRRLDSAASDGRFEDLAHVLFDQAQLAEGRQLRDPGAFVARLNRLLLELDGDPARSPAEPGA